MSKTDTAFLALTPVIDAALRHQARALSVRHGHVLGRFRRDARHMLRAYCADCRERLVVDESCGLIAGSLVASDCPHRVQARQPQEQMGDPR